MCLRLNLAQKGFTIIELLVVFSVVSIIAGIGFASFSSYNESQKLSGSIKTLESFIDDAKNSALSGVAPEQTESGQIINCVQSISSFDVNLCSEATNCVSSGRDYEIVLACGQLEYVMRAGDFQSGVEFGEDDPEDCTSISFFTLSGEVRLDPNDVSCQISLTNGVDTKIFVVDSSANLNEL